MTATSLMILDWATGDIIFGILSDRSGRIKTMSATLLFIPYSPDFPVFHRESWILWSIGSWLGWEWVVFLCSHHAGCGLGSLPTACTCTGCLASTGHSGKYLGLRHFPCRTSWLTRRVIWVRRLAVPFLIGTIPAFLVIPLVLLLKEPTAWLKLKVVKKEIRKKYKKRIDD